MSSAQMHTKAPKKPRAEQTFDRFTPKIAVDLLATRERQRVPGLHEAKNSIDGVSVHILDSAAFCITPTPEELADDRAV
jgi:hypothetical protein